MSHAWDSLEDSGALSEEYSALVQVLLTASYWPLVRARFRTQQGLCWPAAWAFLELSHSPWPCSLLGDNKGMYVLEAGWRGQQLTTGLSPAMSDVISLSRTGPVFNPRIFLCIQNNYHQDLSRW